LKLWRIPRQEKVSRSQLGRYLSLSWGGVERSNRIKKFSYEEVTKVWLTDKQMQAVEAQMATISYIMSNYHRFEEEALKGDSSYFYELGRLLGQNAKQKMYITATDANAVARVVSAVLEEATGTAPLIKVSEDEGG
jgi:hypothetical protein